MFVSNFKILGAVVPEKSLNEKKVYTQTKKKQTKKHCYGKDENYISSIYFICWGYNKENDKHEDADSLLHDTRIRTQCLYKI